VGESVERDGDGTFKVADIVPGGRLSANRPVHLPNFGDCQATNFVRASIPFDRRASAGDSCSVDHARSCNAMVVVVAIGPRVLSERVPSTADSMISTNVPDDMALNEPTRPIDEGMAGTATRMEESMENEPPCELPVMAT